MSLVGQLRLSSGFGEIAIVFCKLSTAPTLPQYKGLTWDATLCVDDIRGSDTFAPCLPGVRVTGVGKHTTREILEHILPYDAILADHIAKPIYPTTDSFLLRGNRLEDWLPELPVDYHYPLTTSARATNRVAAMTGGKPYYIVHPSSIWRTRMRALWNDVWGVDQWADLIARLDCGLSIPGFLLGAPRDSDMATALVNKGAVHEKQVLTLTDVEETIALVRGATYMVGFPAGPTVLAGVLDVPHCMPFRYELQRHLRGTFTDPIMLATGRAYLPYFTDAPAQVALEIMGRMSSFKRASTLANVPSAIRGVVKPSRVLFGDVLRSYPNGASGSVDDWLITIGHHFKPQLVLQMYGHAPWLMRILQGSLKHGSPICQIGVVGIDPVTCTETISPMCARCSPPPRVLYAETLASPALRALKDTHIHAGYGLAFISALFSPNVLSDLQFAYGMLTVPGVVVLAGLENPATREVVQTFANTMQSDVEFPSQMPGWALLYK